MTDERAIELLCEMVENCEKEIPIGGYVKIVLNNSNSRKPNQPENQVRRIRREQFVS
jgi:hypothetical protein